MKKLLILVLFLGFLFFPLRNVLAVADNYVLPYPGLMPGNKLYVIKETWDKFMSLFMWGNFTNFKYELAMADKKIVEAKTLYEYGQLELAGKALADYQKRIQKLPSLLVLAQKEDKIIAPKNEILKMAVKKHLDVLQRLANEVPQQTTWVQEKREVMLNPKQLINQTIILDQNILSSRD